MRIAVFSTMGHEPSSSFVPRLDFFPKRASQWDEFAGMLPDTDITVYCCLPAGHIVDAAADKIHVKPEKVKYVVLKKDASLEEIVERIASDKPDVAAAISIPDAVYDWNPIRDAMVAEALRGRGIPAVANSVFTAAVSFDKWRTSLLLRENGFKCAKGFHVDPELYYAEKRIPEIINNVYREYVHHEMKALSFPIIIKPCSGAGSAGLQVVYTFEEGILKLEESLKETDVMVEEKLSGISFGAEVFGGSGKYYAFPPFMVSSAADGIGDPFTGMRFGPITEEKYHVNELKEMLLRLARLLRVEGNANVDLMFHEGEWYVIEVNPRFSLLSQLIAVSQNRNFFDLLIGMAAKPEETGVMKEPLGFSFDFKTPSTSDEELEKMVSDIPFIRSVMRWSGQVSETETRATCEFILGGFSDRSELLDIVKKMHDRFGELVTDGLLEKIRKFIGLTE